jgi:cytochrome c-type biogenesis protein CcmH/NrfG
MPPLIPRAPIPWQDEEVGLPRTLVVCAVAVSTAACVSNGYLANRGLHYVTDEDGEQRLVRSDPPAPAAYEAYLRARLAIERDPPQLDEARGHILDALRWQPDDPQLWTVMAEIEWKVGNFAAAEDAIAQALALRPGYAEAQRLLARMHEPQAAATAAK